MLFIAGTRFVVEGKERLADTRNVVVMPNHVSQLDAPVVALTLGIDFKAVVKTELYRTPFFGYCLRYAGFIEVDRKDPEQSRPAINCGGRVAQERQLLPDLSRRARAPRRGAWGSSGRAASWWRPRPAAGSCPWPSRGFASCCRAAASA